jgi:septum formation protein
MGIVLASGSPRRFELLTMIGIGDFKVIADTSGEELTPGLSPEKQVCKLALQKAQNAARHCCENDLVIAADTLVYLDSEPLGKPDSRLDAEMMLRKLSGRGHAVYTGVILLRGGIHVSAAEKTNVYFREISSSEISEYVKTGEPMDKAGSYAAQGYAAVFIERIEGDFFNVMGLPLCRLSKMLKEFRI